MEMEPYEKKGADLRKKQPSRRTFLKMAGSAALLLGLGGTMKLLPPAEALRPPGGQAETAFISRCLRCDRCRSACPQAAIGLLHLSDSILGARTPVMEFHHGYCDFCNRCVEVCPTGALLKFDPATVRIGLAVVQRDRCIAWDSRGCRVCEAACPYEAIHLDEKGRPVVDPDRCNGCGRCENVCPSLVLRAYGGGDLRGIKVMVREDAGVKK